MTDVKKDSLPDFKDVESAEYVPVYAGNQQQPMSPNMIISAIGGVYELADDGDDVPAPEGYVPPGNRNGDHDPVILRDKAYRLHAIDTEGELGNFPRVLDPRDNKNAPDKWPSKDTKDGSAAEKAAKQAQEHVEKLSKRDTDHAVGSKTTK